MWALLSRSRTLVSPRSALPPHRRCHYLPTRQLFPRPIHHSSPDIPFRWSSNPRTKNTVDYSNHCGSSSRLFTDSSGTTATTTTIYHRQEQEQIGWSFKKCNSRRSSVTTRCCTPPVTLMLLLLPLLVVLFPSPPTPPVGTHITHT